MQQVFEQVGGGVFLAPLFLLNHFLLNLFLFLQKSGGGGFLPPPPPPPRTIFVCLLSFLIYVLHALIMHKFGVAVHVQYSTKFNFDTRSLKNGSFAVHSDYRRSDGCTW